MIWWALLVACGGAERVAITTVPAATTSGGSDTATADATSSSTDSGAGSDSGTLTDDVEVVDLAVESAYIDEFYGLQRGRAAVVGDFDGDGWFDVFSGNPGDTSYVLRNVTAQTIAFEPAQVLSTEQAMWGGIANDLDNDGDTDLVVTVGGNEFGYEGDDRVFLNDGAASFTEVEAAGLELLAPDGSVVLSATASGFAADFDLDGVLDLFLNRTIMPPSLVGEQPPVDPRGRNGWMLGRGDGTFLDVSAEMGADTSRRWSTRNSAAIDIDNDGDIDVFENNWVGPSRLWQNQLVETGELRFLDVTEAWSLGGADLSWPQDAGAQCTIASDLNQDGFDDMVTFRRGPNEAGEPSVHAAGHLVWINVAGTGFVEVADHTGINLDFLSGRNHDNIGVMGCQVADLNADGIGDAFMGNGRPEAGEPNNLMVSTGLETVTVPDVGEIVVPVYESWSSMIDFPSEHDGVRHGEVTARYPYRTHGTVFADFDNDGVYELGVHNGGPTWAADEDMQEPNRLFDFRFGTPRRWLRVRLEGDGLNVAADPIGTRVEAVVRHADGTTHTVYARQRTSSGFGAQNDSDVFLGLGDGESVETLTVRWTDGTVTEQTIGDRNRVVTIAY